MHVFLYMYLKTATIFEINVLFFWYTYVIFYYFACTNMHFIEINIHVSCATYVHYSNVIKSM